MRVELALIGEGMLQAPTAPPSIDGSAAMGTVKRVVEIMSVLSQQTRDLTIKDIANGLALPPSTVQRLLKLLVSEGVVAYDAQAHTYRPGLSFMRMACGVSDGATIRRLLGDDLHNVVALVQENCSFVLFSEDREALIFLDSVKSPRPTSYDPLDGWVGAHSGSTCLSVLAHLDEDKAVTIAETFV